MDTDLRQFTCRRFCSLTQDRIIFPQADRIAEEIVDFFVFFQSVPIQPRCDIILTVRVVISKLCIAEFISCKKHRRSAAAHQCCKRIFYHAAAQALDFRIICCAFCPTVPTVSIVITIRISPAVFLVVLHIIRIQII